MFKIIILQLFLALQFPLLNDEPLEDQTHTVNQDQLTTFWQFIIIVENVLTYAGLTLIDLMIVVQINMTLPTINHVLICSSELRQLLS